MPKARRNTQDKSSDVGKAQSPRRSGKSRAGGRSAPKDVKNEDRSGNVYENKGPNDNLPDTKDDISAWLNAILHRNTGKNAYFAEIAGSLVTIWALENESIASKGRTSRHGRPARGESWPRSPCHFKMSHYPIFGNSIAKQIYELKQNDAVAPKPFVKLLCAPQAKRLLPSLARGVAGHFSPTFPTKNTPLEEEFAFFLRKVYASYEKAWLATVGAFRTYGTARESLREGMNYYEPQPTSQIHQ